MLNSRMTEGRLNDLDRLESMTVDEYYSVLNTWLKKIRSENQEVKKQNKLTSK
jgi:hypothetical protein